MSDKNDKSKLAQAVEAARGHPDPERDIPLMNQVAKVLKTTNSERQATTMDHIRARDSCGMGTPANQAALDRRYLLSQVERMRERMEAIADVPDGYHDCSDYERGYGDARAATRAMIRVAIKDIFP